MGTEPQTLNELFNSAVARLRDSEFLRFKRDGAWRSLTFGEVARRVRELAFGLRSLGVEKGQRIAIWSENRPEWNLADLASLAIGAIDVPIYATQAPAQVEYILADSESRVLFVSAAFAKQALEIKAPLPFPGVVVTFGGATAGLIDIEELVDRGRNVSAEQPGVYESLWRSASASDLATIL